MNKYRLKKEAVPFFKSDLATSIIDYDIWVNQYNIDPKALEEVAPMYIKYGIPLGESGNSLSGWNELGKHFHFTIYFPNVEYSESDKFGNGRIVRELMDKIQVNINNFYEEFANKEIDLEDN